MIIIGGSASEQLAERVSEELDCEYTTVERKQFPDGEIYVRIPEKVEGKETVIIQSTCHPPNQNYIELFLLLDAVRDLGAKKITTVIPYFAYARQDDRFKSGEAISFQTVAKLIESAGADEVYTIDLHAHQIGGTLEVFNISTRNLTATPLLAQYAAEEFELDNPVIMGPDGEARQWAEKASDSIGADWDFMTKERLGPEEVEIKPRELEVKGKDVLLIDDIISTGRTIVKAIQILEEHGANNVYAACTHPVLVTNALEKIEMAGAEEVIGTDTIPSKISVVSVAPLIAEAITQ